MTTFRASFRCWYDLPPRCLHPNQLRGNSRTAAIMRSQAKQTYRWHVIGMTGRVMWDQDLGYLWTPLWGAANVQLTYVFPSRARRDKDNLLAWWKAGFDGLVAAGLLSDDDNLTHLPVLIEIDRDEPLGRVGVEAWPDATGRLEEA